MAPKDSIAVRATIYIDREILEAFQLECLKRNVSVSEKVRDLIERSLEEELYSDE